MAFSCPKSKKALNLSSGACEFESYCCMWQEAKELNWSEWERWHNSLIDSKIEIFQSLHPCIPYTFTTFHEYWFRFFAISVCLHITYLLNVHQLGLVHLCNCDMVFGCNSETPLRRKLTQNKKKSTHQQTLSSFRSFVYIYKASKSTFHGADWGK